ncbi:MAG: sigma-70 family RNA polymerase sigma factor [Bacteroidia bacterium]|nr:sigma-70 family RNA polymerase sigma factor [Bacteroidia bacterium]
MKNNPYQAKSDSALVQCFLGGDSRCFDEIVVRHHPHVHNLLHYKLRNATWEKDAEQETFITVAMEIRNGHYHDTGHLGQYLNTVAYNEAIEILRRENHYVHNDTSLRTDEQAEQPNEEIFPEREQKTALLRFVMNKLSPRYRLVLELRDVDELSFREIGLRMEISEVSARTLYWKAKKRVKHNIENILAERRTAQNSRHSR